MFLKKYPLRRIALCNAAIGLLLIIIVIALLNAINQAMWNATEGTIRSLTQLSGDAFESAIQRDVQSLEAFKESLVGAGAVTPATAIGLMRRYVATSPFSHIAVVDERGKGYFAGGEPLDVNNDEAWHNFGKDAPISRAYFGDGGQRLVTIKRPLIVDGRHKGDVFGSLALKTYYQPSAMTFFNGRGSSHMLSARTGEYLLSAWNSASEKNRADLYTVLAASPENAPERIAALRQAMNEGKSGSTVMDIQGRRTYLYYTPIGTANDWFMLSMIPLDAMHRAANYVNVLVGIVCVIIPAGLFVMFFLARRRHTLALEIEARHYRDFLFHILSGSTDSVFLIYNASRRSMEYVFDNLERVLGISMRACRDNPSALFDHCVFKTGSRLRDDFETASISTARSEDCRIINPATGEKRWVKFSLTPKEDTDGQTYYVISLNDITEEKAVRRLLRDSLAAAEQASRAKSSFLSAMSHDIRTPMNAIVGFTTLAASRLDQPEKVEEYLNKIKSSSTHLLSLINDILDMSHIESGKVSLDEQPYNLVDLLDDLYSIIQAETSARQLYFSINTESVRHTEVRCDKLRINQILLNLLGNALKFTNPGGFIKVTLDELPGAPVGYGRYRFTVSDTGIGMSPEFVEHIFDPFERERTSTISGIQGTGLGMAITKNLVDMMHGTISVKSTQGKGTSFTVELTLQLACEGATAAAQEAKTQHVDPSHRLRHSRILLVDDNDLNREIAITLLEDEGFTVECAVNGCEAVEKIMDAPSGHYQLVLMDVQMPVMNGYEATKAIRRLNDPTRAQVPILAMTADAFEEDRQKALRSGMNGHLTKPVEIDKLFEALDEVLS